MKHRSIEPLIDARGNPYYPAVAPALRKLLVLIFCAVAVLSANGVYLASITGLESATGRSYQNPFYFWMFLLHVAVGLLFIVPFVAFGLLHMRTALKRPNRRAVHAGIALFSTACLVIVSGCTLLKRDLGEPWNGIAYWAHVLSPLAAVGLYVAHRLAGPAIAWKWGAAWGGSVAAFVAATVVLHSQDPRAWYQVGPKDGERYFQPSLARTSTGKFIPEDVLAMDEYCLECHPDTYGDWFHSAHHFSSFNNPAYRYSVRETRQVALARDGSMQAARWCAGCHDPVPFFGGKFDDPHYDDLNDPTAHAGITCTTCHAITNLNSPRGNGDYTIEEPLHYPFARSESPFLQWINAQLVKGKPAFHKKTFLKPFHKTAEFCSVCHKVHLPYELNNYKEFLRGQNHYDTYLLSGVSGHGARSFYYPEKSKPNCSEDCHMPYVPSHDFGHKDGRIHNHLFPGANTGLAELRGHEPTRKAQEDFLKDGQVRIDIFALREGGTISGKLIAPLRPELPALRRGDSYLVEVVLRTLKMGHHLTQGTTDSNELWVDLEAAVAGASGSQAIGRSGAIDERGTVDPWSHFVNVLMLDRNGNRIDRRNAQDIFVPLYNHQIPPGAAQVVHYLLRVPEDASGPVELRARLRYRKFDATFMTHVFGEGAPNLTPADMCEDRIVLPVEGVAAQVAAQESQVIPWQRWNDYGIGLLLEGSEGSEKGELRQAEEVFRKVAELGRADGWVNLGRVYFKEGRVDDAVQALGKAIDHPEPAPLWVASWLSGLVNRQNGNLDAAIRDFEKVLATFDERRGFDFSRDYEVWNDLGLTLFHRSKRSAGAEQRRLLERARDAFLVTDSIDPENMTAHHNLYQVYARLHALSGDPADEREAKRHLELFERYKPDDNARDRAHKLHREKNPAANKAAQSIVIYELRPTS
ncbi:MAG: tetratricopeptide repeat protein [Planctomycetes bacterium]|nr:tetratricopeptide repeat protein [Planctomycetota bacterium]